MFLSQKCQYALRAIFELAKLSGQGPVKIAEIAEAQAIPVRFLEVILSQLKQAGFATSQRGNKGGYLLICSPGELTVGEVIRFMQGPVGPVECVAGASRGKCPLYGNCAFLPMWEKVQKAVSDVYDNTTFQDLLDQEKQKFRNKAICYSI
jgi:Rrf2 family cysteine metabolism transcriptional repressor